MTLVKTSLLNAISVVVKMLTLLGINKILAIYVGPAGYAAIGQFQNAVQMITSFASGAINTGVTKYTAEYSGDEDRQRSVWRTAGTIALYGSITASIFIAIFNKSLSNIFLNESDYSGIFLWFSASLIFFTLNALMMAMLNGKKEISSYVVANIIGSIFSFFVTALLTILFGLYGALVSLAIYQSFSFFITLFICYRTSWFKVGYLFGPIDRNIASNLGKFTLMALTSAVFVPVSHVLIRNYLGQTLGWVSAGYWEAMWRMSTAYLLLFTTTLSLYFLPKLSSLHLDFEIKSEIKLCYRIILPIAIAGGLSIYILRNFVIILLFSKEFLPMNVLFFWQLVGDVLKIGSWVLGYLMLAKAMVKIYIATEIIFSFGFVLLTYILTPTYGLLGVVIAHAVNYLLYWFAIHILLKNKSFQLN